LFSFVLLVLLRSSFNKCKQFTQPNNYDNYYVFFVYFTGVSVRNTQAFQVLQLVFIKVCNLDHFMVYLRFGESCESV
jgi:hypothetical protein